MKKKYSVVSFYRGREIPWDLLAKYKDWELYCTESDLCGFHWVYHFRREKV